MTTTLAPTDSGRAPVNGLELYWESLGSGGTPLVMLHGGYGQTAMLGGLPARLAEDRRVVAVDLQGHGRTADIDRPLTYEALGDDIAALTQHLGLGSVDLMGYSLGGGTALRTAIQHPDRVRRLVVVASPFSRAGWYPDIQEQMSTMDRGLFEMFRQTPLYAGYAAVAPDVAAFPTLMDKMGALLSADYDWSDEVRGLPTPTMLVVGDADSMPPSYAAEFFALLGGGLRDGGWDGSGVTQHQLAIIPGATHHTVITAPALQGLVQGFLDD